MLNRFSYYLVIVMKIFLVIVTVLVIVTKISLMVAPMYSGTQGQGTALVPCGYTNAVCCQSAARHCNFFVHWQHLLIVLNKINFRQYTKY